MHQRSKGDRQGARVLKNFGAPLATKFTYKMRSGGIGMWGRGPALYKHNYLKTKIMSQWCYTRCNLQVIGMQFIHLD
jgi:hypothetical protein